MLENYNDLLIDLFESKKKDKTKLQSKVKQLFENVLKNTTGVFISAEIMETNLETFNLKTMLKKQQQINNSIINKQTAVSDFYLKSQGYFYDKDLKQVVTEPSYYIVMNPEKAKKLGLELLQKEIIINQNGKLTRYVLNEKNKNSYEINSSVNFNINQMEVIVNAPTKKHLNKVSDKFKTGGTAVFINDRTGLTNKKSLQEFSIKNKLPRINFGKENLGVIFSFPLYND